jgi:hypothetical protein
VLTVIAGRAMLYPFKYKFKQTDEVEIKPVVHVQRVAGDENGNRTQTGKWTTEGSGKSISESLDTCWHTSVAGRVLALR